MFVISHLVCEVKTLIIVSILPKMNCSRSLMLKIEHMFFLLRENTKCCSHSLFKMFYIKLADFLQDLTYQKWCFIRTLDIAIHIVSILVCRHMCMSVHCVLAWVHTYVHTCFKSYISLHCRIFKLKLRLPYLEVKLMTHSRQLYNLEIWTHNNRHVFFMDSTTFSLTALW